MENHITGMTFLKGKKVNVKFCVLVCINAVCNKPSIQARHNFAQMHGTILNRVVVICHR